MLVSTTSECWTQDERIGFYLRGLVAFDPATGAELDASNGRRKSGRGRRYTCRVRTGETVWRETNKGRCEFPEKRTAFTVTAHTEAEAIERANKALTRFLNKRPVWHAESYTWTFEPKEVTQ